MEEGEVIISVWVDIWEDSGIGWLGRRGGRTRMLEFAEVWSIVMAAKGEGKGELTCFDPGMFLLIKHGVDWALVDGWARDIGGLGYYVWSGLILV